MLNTDATDGGIYSTGALSTSDYEVCLSLPLLQPLLESSADYAQCCCMSMARACSRDTAQLSMLLVLQAPMLRAGKRRSDHVQM